MIQIVVVLFNDANIYVLVESGVKKNPAVYSDNKASLYM